MVRSAPLTLCLALAAAGCGDKAPTATDADGDGFAAGEDCDDGDASVHPGAPEVCNGADDDCDGEADAGAWRRPGMPTEMAMASATPRPSWRPTPSRTGTWRTPRTAMTAARGPGRPASRSVMASTTTATERRTRAWWTRPPGSSTAVGTASSSTTRPRATGCDGASGYAPEGGDCDDDDPDSHPGAPEACDGVDNDCNDAVDDVSEGDAGAITVYPDGDRDGFGDDSGARAACAPEADEAVVPGDCNDANATVYPDAPEQCETPLDENCDGSRAPCERALADATVRAWGAGAGHRLGVAVVGGMDVNGDGTATRRSSPSGRPGHRRGEVYVRLGPVTPSGQRVDTIADAHLRPDRRRRLRAGPGDARRPRRRRPRRAAGRGPRGQRPRGPAGAAASSAARTRRGGLDSGDALATWAGESDGDEAEALVAPAGDVTGDGIADLLVGARETTTRPRTPARSTCCPAPTRPRRRTRRTPPPSSWARRGKTVGKVASAAEPRRRWLNLLIGAPNAPRVAGDNVGVVWLVRGPVTGAVGLGDADATLEGAAALAAAGATRAAAEMSMETASTLLRGVARDRYHPARRGRGLPDRRRRHGGQRDEAGLADVATATIAGSTRTAARPRARRGRRLRRRRDGDLLVGAYTAAGVAGGVVLLPWAAVRPRHGRRPGHAVQRDLGRRRRRKRVLRRLHRLLHRRRGPHRAPRRGRRRRGVRRGDPPPRSAALTPRPAPPLG